MLTVGIHEGVIVSKAIRNDQGTLEIEFLRKGSDDAVAALAGTAELIPDQDVNIRVYPQSVDYFGEKRDGTTMLKLIVNFRNVLSELLQVYIDNPDINATKGLVVTNENAKVLFTDQANVDLAYDNIVSQFIAAITPFVGKESHPFRVKFPRRSKKYSFASLPNFGPWVESMDIPQESSKIKWSNWEITNGKNDPTPAKDKVAKKEVSLNEEALANVFTSDDDEDDSKED